MRRGSMIWTDDDIRTLKAMAASGSSALSIGVRLKRTPRAVKAKAISEGVIFRKLKPRRTPPP